MGGRFISLIGSNIQMMALPLYILDLTGSGTLMGVFSVLTIVPALITAPFSGIIGDRKNRRNVMIATDIGRGLLICFLGVMAMIGKLNIYVLFTLQVFISIMDSLFNSSSSALMPDLISKEEIMEANSAKGGLDAAAMILGPALGGVIYGIWGIKMVFYINGISFIMSSIFSMFISYNRKIVQREKINGKVFFNETSEALKFIGSKKGLLQLFIFALISNFLISPMFNIIMPYALKKEIGFSSQQYGYIMCFLTVGMLLGNVGISVYFKKLGSKKLMKSGLIIESIVTVAVCGLVFPQMVGIYGGATWALFSSVGACYMIIGFCNAFVNTPISTNFQNLVPDEMRSRFFAIFGMFSQGAIPLGSLLNGILLDSMKYYNLLAAINILFILVSAVFLVGACDDAYEAKSQETIQG